MADVDAKIEITGNVFDIVASISDCMDEDQTEMYLESLKIEIQILAPEPNVLNEVLSRRVTP